MINTSFFVITSSQWLTRTVLRMLMFVNRARAIQCRNCDQAIDLAFMAGGFTEFGCPQCGAKQLRWIR